MRYFLYILLCDQKTYYVGVTQNLVKRKQEHKERQSFFTKKFSDIKLAYYEEFLSLTLARRREKQKKKKKKKKKKGGFLKKKRRKKIYPGRLGKGIPTPPAKLVL